MHAQGIPHRASFLKESKGRDGGLEQFWARPARRNRLLEIVTRRLWRLSAWHGSS